MSTRLVAPILLALILPAFSIGWRNAASTDGLVAPVNMTLADGRLFVSDRYTGVLVYDISDPTSPSLITVIPLQGNEGTAIKDGFLYANERDLLHVLKETETGYEIVATLKPQYNNDGGDGNPVPLPGVMDESSGGFACACSSNNNFEPMSAPGPSSSSYATFALVGDFLYRVDYSHLVVYDVAIADQPSEVERIGIGWEIETIFPANDHLFLGGMRGMYIYSLEVPTHPRQLAQIEHVRACDPVVVSGPVAYVTLRGSGACGGDVDELLCIDVTHPGAPRIIGQKPIATPYGLAVREPFLYVSNGEGGYTLVDVTSPTAPVAVAAWNDGATRDFIWDADRLYVLGRSDVRIYNVADPRTPVLLSRVIPNPS